MMESAYDKRAVAEHEGLGPGGSRNPSSMVGKDLTSECLHFPPSKSRSQGKIEPRFGTTRHSLTAEGACQIKCQLNGKSLGT
jgi:hypothetical protein